MRIQTLLHIINTLCSQTCKAQSQEKETQMNTPEIPYDRNHEGQHTTYCLTEDAACVDFLRQEAQILLDVSNVDETGQICINIQDAYALGLWLIGSATAIQTRCPEMVGK